MRTNLLHILSALALTTSALFAAEAIGMVRGISGDVSIIRTDGLQEPLALDSRVYLGDRVISKANSQVRLLFIDGSSIGQGENSELLINDYVFNPAYKEESAAHFKLFKGVFRVITDNITKINPDRFKVSTGHATIGIRGCELGFEVGATEDRVWVAALHHADSVIVEGNQAGLDAVVITDGGRGVRASGAGLDQFEFDPADFLDVIERTTPKGSATQISGADWGDWSNVEGPWEISALRKRIQQDIEQDIALVELEPPPKPRTRTVARRSSSSSSSSSKPKTVTAKKPVAKPVSKPASKPTTVVTPPVVPVVPDDGIVIIRSNDKYEWYLDEDGKERKRKIKKPDDN